MRATCEARKAAKKAASGQVAFAEPEAPWPARGTPKHDQQARGLLLMAVRPMCQDIILTASSAAEAHAELLVWAMPLHEQVARQINGRWSGFKMQPGLSVAAWYNKVVNMRDMLAGAGIHMADEDISHTILCGLLPEYRLITLFYHKDPPPLAELYNIVVMQAAMLDERKPSTFRGRRHLCANTGHMEATCPLKGA